MNREEKIAETYLKSKGFQDIQFEPDGNIPPDFFIDGEIAVEVRRLNQHYEHNGKADALESVNFKLIPMLNKLLKSYEGEGHISSSFVCITYWRPVGKIKERIKKIKEILDNHLNDLSGTKTYKVCDSVEIEVLPSSKRFESPYVLGSMSDMNNGGFVVAEVHKNLQLIYEEKSRKIAPYKHKYKNWWLVLIDQIGYGLDKASAEQIREISAPSTDWQKVILVSPIKHEHGTEI